MQNFNGETYKTYKVQDLIPFTKPDMIKIDVEGFEIEVFKNDNDRINFNGIEYSLYENFYTYNEEENYKFAPLINFK